MHGSSGRAVEPRAARRWSWPALQLLVLVPFTVSSGLMAPLWAVLALYALWAAAVVLLVRVARRPPLAAPLVPLANGALWWLAMAAGGALLGWTP